MRGLGVAKNKEKETKETITAKVLVQFWFKDRMVKKGDIVELTESECNSCLKNNLIERG